MDQQDDRLFRTAAAGMDKGSILAVDDDPDVLFFIRLALENEGFSVSCAESGRDALALLGQHRYAIMLTDLNMPVMDGFELARRARHLQPELAIIMGTGQLYPGIHRQAASVGIQEVFGKPFDYDRLVRLLHAITDQHLTGKNTCN
ncbi:response regulator [Geobacter pickeringii]|uniref:response regulator n=1 Tax=Geobacter pickeringii TaxID=345632 RepID=UPI00069241D9|nr:response regulator [Geobacter pickeringii]